MFSFRSDRERDSRILNSSEVYRNFRSNLQKNSQKELIVQQKERQEVLAQWNEMEQAIQSSPTLKQKFAKLQQEFITHPESRTKYSPVLVSGILALNFSESEDL